MSKLLTGHLNKNDHHMQGHQLHQFATDDLCFVNHLYSETTD